MLSSIGIQSSCGQRLRVVDKNWLQRVRVKPDEKLKTAEASKPPPQPRSPDNLLDLSTDFDFNANSNSADFLDLGNSQMSSLFREFADDQKSLLKDEERKTANANYKTVRGTGFYSCELCPFFCLDVKLFLEHKEQDDHNSTYPGLVGTLPFKSKCIGCDNVFYSAIVLRCHLIEDHKVSSIEIDRLIQLCIEASDDDILYEVDHLPQTINNNLTDVDSVNDTILNCSESGQKSHFMDTQNQIAEENNFVDNCSANETSNEYWDNQEQIFNGLQDNNNNNNVIENHQEKLFVCLIGTCKVRFETEENSMYHEKCHSAYGFRCIELECEYTDTRWLSMMTHLWKTHRIDIEMFSCNQCEFKTNSQYKLNTFHKNVHKSEKPFMCPECNKGFKSIKQLRNHKVIHNKKTIAEKSLRTDLTCMHCSRNFCTKNLLHQHITSIHIRARPFACLECNYTTSVASSLRLHMRSHTGEKPFKCEECSYSSADHNTLRKHKMRHTGQKNYRCPLCNYSCIQSSSYKKHLETKHPGMDDGIVYNCDMCNFTFIRKDLYMLHIVKHKEDALQNNGICEPLVSLDEILNEKEKIQAEIGEQPYLINTIRVKPLNTLIPKVISNHMYSHVK